MSSTATEKRPDERAGDQPDARPVRRVGGGPLLPTPVVLASLAIAVLAALGFFVTGSPDRSVRTEVANGPVPGRSDAQPPPAASEPPTPRAQDSPGRQGKADRDSDKATKRRDRQAPAVPVRTASVDVYNNTAVTGLAAQTAERVRGLGWTVVAESNWTGSIPETTVYYPAALAEQAKLLADDLGVSRVRPAVSPMSFERLTLILSGSA